MTSHVVKIFIKILCLTRNWAIVLAWNKGVVAIFRELR